MKTSRTLKQAEKQEGDHNTRVTFAAASIINLIRVPGVQQVMLQVRIGELDRTALRQIGADFLVTNESAIVGTQIGGAGIDFLEGLTLGSTSTLFGLFPKADFDFVLSALRRNSVLTLLAEPNLVAMNGQQASFLAGGEFPVPIQTGLGTGGISVEFKEFGVQLNFVPYILDDETIRLRVAPEVSTVDFALGATLVPGGSVVPGVNTRRADTTVEMRQGQTLAIAGLLNIDRNAETDRLPGVGDVPIFGPLFQRTEHRITERELLVMVTPRLVAPMSQDQCSPLPGSEIQDPDDYELYWLHRIEGRTGQPFRPTGAWDDPFGKVERMPLRQRSFHGPVGHSK